MIPERLEKVNEWRHTNKSDLFTAALIFLVGMGGFGLGRLSALWQDKTPLEIIDAEQGNMPAASSTNAAKTEAGDRRGRFVASKSGKYYHFPWCSGARNISEGNKIWLANKEEAAARGYKPADNCPGL